MHLTAPWPGPAAWRQAARTLIAVAIADALTRALHLHSGYWAMITVTVVVQGNLGGTLDAGLTQFAGTVVGGLLGIGGVMLRTHHLAPDWAVLLAVLTPLAVLSASDAHLRTGPVTALIVLLVTPTAGSSIDLALGRIGEIAIGSIIGIAVSILIFPGRASAALDRSIADALRALGARAHADLICAADDEAIDRSVHAAIVQADEARAALARERSLHLGGAAPIDPVLRALRRLRTDVAILGDATGDMAPDQALADAIRDWFDQAAATVLHRTATPPPGALRHAAAAIPGAGPLSFAMQVLQRDAGDFAERLRDYTATSKPPDQSDNATISE